MLKRWKTYVGLVVIVMLSLSVLFLKVPLYYQARSYILMYAFSKYEQANSLLKEQNIKIDIPGGNSTEKKDWYPFVMLFNDDRGFSQYMGKDLSLTVLYNFGAFNWNTSSSFYFQEDSPYFNSFYGGYLVKANTENQIFGFEDDGQVNLEEVFTVPEYDYKYLVLQSFGCPEEKLTMEILSHEITKNVSYAGYDNWTQIDSFLLVNSPVHKYKGDRRAYIQYGNPLKQGDKEDFPLITTQGRIYVRYFEEFKNTVFLYIISPNRLTIDECDHEILSKTVISKSKEKI